MDLCHVLFYVLSEFVDQGEPQKYNLMFACRGVSADSMVGFVVVWYI
jgi:hypothetical protein